MYRRFAVGLGASTRCILQESRFPPVFTRTLRLFPMKTARIDFRCRSRQRAKEAFVNVIRSLLMFLFLLERRVLLVAAVDRTQPYACRFRDRCRRARSITASDRGQTRAACWRRGRSESHAGEIRTDDCRRTRDRRREWTGSALWHRLHTPFRQQGRGAHVHSYIRAVTCICRERPNSASSSSRRWRRKRPRREIDCLWNKKSALRRAFLFLPVQASRACACANRDPAVDGLYATCAKV